MSFKFQYPNILFSCETLNNFVVLYYVMYS